MKREIIINSIPSKTLAKTIIDNLEIDSPHVVKFFPHVKKRSDAMRRLYFLQVDALAHHVGYSDPKELHEWMKEEFLFPIFARDDQDFSELIAAARAAGQGALRALKRNVSTNDATSVQMSEYMERIKWQAAEYGLTLPVPEDLRWVAV
jgi:hypothetical protein